MQYVMLRSVLQVFIDICLQQLEHERYQEKQQLVRAILQQMDHKRWDLQGIFQDFLLLERLLQVLAPGNEKNPSF